MKINFSRIGGTYYTGDINTIHLDNSSIKLDYQNELLDFTLDFHSMADIPIKINFMEFIDIRDNCINLQSFNFNYGGESSPKLSIVFENFNMLEKFCKKLNKEMKKQKDSIVLPQVL